MGREIIVTPYIIIETYKFVPVIDAAKHIFEEGFLNNSQVRDWLRENIQIRVEDVENPIGLASRVLFQSGLMKREYKGGFLSRWALNRSLHSHFGIVLQNNPNETRRIGVCDQFMEAFGARVINHLNPEMEMPIHCYSFTEVKASILNKIPLREGERDTQLS